MRPHRVPGSELSERLSTYYLCATATSLSLAQNSVSSLFRNCTLEQHSYFLKSGSWKRGLGLRGVSHHDRNRHNRQNRQNRYGCLLGSVFCRTSNRRARCSPEPPKRPKPSWRLPPLNPTPLISSSFSKDSMYVAPRMVKRYTDKWLEAQTSVAARYATYKAVVGAEILGNELCLRESSGHGLQPAWGKRWLRTSYRQCSEPIALHPSDLDATQLITATTLIIAQSKLQVQLLRVVKTVLLANGHFAGVTPAIFVDFRGPRSKIPCFFFIWAECNSRIFANFRQNHLFSAGDRFPKRPFRQPELQHPRLQINECISNGM